MCSGHRKALKYPLGLLQDEAALIMERENMGLITHAFIARNAHAAVMVEEGNEIFNDMIEVLEDGE